MLEEILAEVNLLLDRFDKVQLKDIPEFDHAEYLLKAYISLRRTKYFLETYKINSKPISPRLFSERD